MTFPSMRNMPTVNVDPPDLAVFTSQKHVQPRWFSIKGRALLVFMGLDVATFLLLYVVLLPVMAVLIYGTSEAVSTGLRYGLSLLRLGLVGYYTARSIRRKTGLASRSSALPTIMCAAVIATLVTALLEMVTIFTVPGHAFDWLVLGNCVEWTVFAGLGAALVTPGSPNPFQSQKHVRLKYQHGDHGQAQAEYVGIISVAVLLVGALIIGATPIGQTIAAKLCEAFGTTCGAVSKSQVKGPPKEPCPIVATKSRGSATLSVIVDVNISGDYTVERMSDGTYRVTSSTSAGAGYGASAGGASAKITVNDQTYGGKMDAGAGVEGSKRRGETVVFNSKAEADEYLAYVQRQTPIKAASNAIGLPGTKTIVGKIASGVAEWTAGVVNGKGTYKPPAPSEVFTEGRVTVKGDAELLTSIGALGLSAEGSSSLGMLSNVKSGHTTVFYDLDVAGNAGAGTVPAGPEAAANGRVAAGASATIDRNGKVVGTTFTFEATGGAQGSLGKLFNDPDSGDVSEQNGTRYQMSFDLTDPKQKQAAEDLAASIAKGDFSVPALTDPARQERLAAVARGVSNNAEFTRQNVTSTSKEAFGGELALEAVGLGAGGSISFGEDRTIIKDSSYWAGSGPGGGWKDWNSCSS